MIELKEKKLRYSLKRKRMKGLIIEDGTLNFAKFENNNCDIFTICWGKELFTKLQRIYRVGNKKDMNPNRNADTNF